MKRAMAAAMTCLFPSSTVSCLTGNILDTERKVRLCRGNVTPAGDLCIPQFARLFPVIPRGQQFEAMLELEMSMTIRTRI
ncbi:hypothetical protein NDU88_002762 [Pleurodeles waltl]|uniref:Secreted protein n=1 Tax=Pleurodeles waltl TaxID=8319 RepID=A0AAV7VFW9_PLEWA|nr:hypothetical protein NDU88_002762 [Pleurodeles waltl]